MANAEVIKFFKRKSQTGFEAPTYFGAEQRFVGALRNSNVNNLEEQFVLGSDTYIEKYINEEGNGVIEISYCTEETGANAGYYKVISTTYKSDIQNEDFFFDNYILHFPSNINEVAFGDNSQELPDTQALYGNLGTNVETLSFSNEDLRIYPTSFTVVRVDELHYIKGSDDILVLTKTISKKYLDNGTREVIKQNITNHIAQ